MAVTECIFCNQPFGPGRPRSQEHAAPQWCKELLPDLGPALHEHIRVTPEGRTDTELGTRDPFTTVCGDVCEPCNNGWMHELEESAKWYLRPLIQGESRNQRFWRQTLCATWAVKTALVWDSVMPQHSVIPRSVLHTFHRTQRLNLRQQVWVGHYVGPQPHHSFRQTAAHIVGEIAEVTGPPLKPDDAHVYACVVTMGQAAYLVVGHILDVPYSHALPDELAPKLVPVWPPHHEVVSWPPQEGLSDEDIRAALMSVGEPMDGEAQIPI